MHSRDERRTTQNSGICSPGEDGEMYYGQLEEILEFSYMSFKTVLFRVKCLSDLEITALHIDGQSINVDAPPDIIDDDDDDDDEDDDIIHDDDVLDLAYFDDEDLVNVDDDDDLKRGHDGDGGDDDHPPPHQLADGCREFRKGIDQHRGKIYTDNKSSLKKDYWEEMQRLHALGEYTYDQIMVMVRKGMQRGHIPSVGRGLARRGKDVLDVLLQSQHETGSGSGSGSESGAGVDNKSGDDKDAKKDEEDANS
nr:EF-hand domain pair [Tanacetum cinerariifolium]